MSINYERDKAGAARVGVAPPLGDLAVALRRCCARLTTRRVGFLLCGLGYVWALALFALTITDNDSTTLAPDAYQVMSPQSGPGAGDRGPVQRNGQTPQMWRHGCLAISAVT